MKYFSLIIIYVLIFCYARMQNEPRNPGIPTNNMPADSVAGADSLTPHQQVKKAPEGSKINLAFNIEESTMQNGNPKSQISLILSGAENKKEDLGTHAGKITIVKDLDKFPENAIIGCQVKSGKNGKNIAVVRSNVTTLEIQIQSIKDDKTIGNFEHADELYIPQNVTLTNSYSGNK